MISFIVPFSTIEKDKFLNLNEKEDLWEEVDPDDMSLLEEQTIKFMENLNNND